jgi:hypothetical protein
VTQRLAAAAARHPWRTVGAWFAAVLVSVVLIVFFLWKMLKLMPRIKVPVKYQADYRQGETL